MAWNYEKILYPIFWIEINGQRLSDFYYKFIEEVIYEDHATGSDVCSVTISDPAMEFISDPVFASRAKFKLIGGYQTKYREMLDGYICAVDYVFSDDNTPQLIIHAMDKSHELDRNKKKRSWSKKSRYQVAQAIAKEYGLNFSGKTTKLATKVEETISQSNQTDMELLISMADECEMIVYVKGSTLYFTERNYEAKPQGKLNYRKPDFSLLEFTPRVVQKDIPEEVDVQDINTKGQQEKGKANASTPSKTPANTGKKLTTVNKEYGSGNKATNGPALIYDGDIKRVEQYKK